MGLFVLFLQLPVGLKLFQNKKFVFFFLNEVIQCLMGKGSVEDPNTRGEQITN